jgi:hypothetical protein
VRHRTAAGRALGDVDDAARFLAELGLLLQTPDPWLPSLFGAAQGTPAKPGAAGFGQWPAHAWSWAGELAARGDVLLTKVCGKRTLVHARLWPALDAAVRGRTLNEPDARLITAALEEHPGVRSDELRRLAGLDAPATRPRFQKALGRLEALGIVLARPTLVEKHTHVALVQLWTQRFREPLAATAGVSAFVHAALAAAGSAPAQQVQRWFAWPRAEVERALSELISSGRVVQRAGE